MIYASLKIEKANANVIRLWDAMVDEALDKLPDATYLTDKEHAHALATVALRVELARAVIADPSPDTALLYDPVAVSYLDAMQYVEELKNVNTK